MKPGTPGFCGERLTEAREARGLSAPALADLLGISRQALYQYEDGSITPGPAVMHRLASVLRLPVAFFLSHGDESPEPERVYFRSLKSTDRLSHLRARRRLRWLARITDYVCQFVDLPSADIPDYGFPADPAAIRDEEIEQAAADLRRRWGLGDGPISNIAWLLENHGIAVAREDLGASELDAVSAKAGDHCCMILGADKASAARSRLDASHELGHYVVHPRCPEPTSERDPAFALTERQAFRFGGAFLLPAESFAGDVWAGSLDEMLALKPKWKVSVGAMITRSERLDMISPEQARRLWQLRTRRGWHKREPFDEELPVEQPMLFRRSFELMLDAGVVSRDKILADLPYDASDIEDLAGLPRGVLSDGPSPLALRGRASEPPAAIGAEILEFRRRS